MRKVVTAVTVSAALLGAAFIAPAAQAAPCDGVGAQQPFLDWHDQGQYVLVDGGDFESAAAGWTLSGGAATTPGGNTFRLDSIATSLSLPAGSSATSPSICVSKGNPTARLFASAPVTNLAKEGALGVEVLYLNADGSVRKVKKAGKLHPGTTWGPTRKFSLAQGQFHQHGKPDDGSVPPGHDPNFVPPGHDPDHNPGGGASGDKPHGHGHKPGGGTAQIQLRFTPLGGGWLIDDVFVDPRMRL